MSDDTEQQVESAVAESLWARAKAWAKANRVALIVGAVMGLIVGRVL